MYTQEQHTKRGLEKTMFCILLFGILLYAGYEARFIVAGPSVSIETPTMWSATSSQRVLVSGNTSHIAFLSINNVQAFTDTSGHFSKEVSLPPGYAIITIAAKDRFGRSISRVASITVLDYCPIS